MKANLAGLGALALAASPLAAIPLALPPQAPQASSRYTAAHIAPELQDDAKLALNMLAASPASSS